MVTPFGSSLRCAPLDPEYRAALHAVFNKTLRERWGVRRKKLKQGLLDLFELLLGQRNFAEGGRIAMSSDALVRGLRRTERWLKPLIEELQDIPELVTVVRVPAGGLDFNGHLSPAGHFECELGPRLRALGGRAPDAELLPLPPRNGRPVTGHTPYAAMPSGKTLVRMPPEYLASLRKVAAANNTSLGGAIVVLLDQHQQFRELLSQPLAR